MRVLITGTQGLAAAIDRQCKLNHDITISCVGRSTGHDIEKVQEWYQQYYDFDAVINCAYHGFAQVEVLESFAHIWAADSHKQIINVGSIVTDHVRSEARLDGNYWPYRCHKQSLQLAAQAMMKDRKCIVKLINFGAVDTAMTANLSVPKLDVDEAARYVITMLRDPNLRRIDLWK